eukprot:4994884-Amphidinium_carterae.1
MLRFAIQWEGFATIRGDYFGIYGSILDQGRSFGDEASTTADSGDHAPVEEWDLGSMEKKMQEIAARTLGDACGCVYDQPFKIDVRKTK